MTDEVYTDRYDDHDSGIEKEDGGLALKMSKKSQES